MAVIRMFFITIVNTRIKHVIRQEASSRRLRIDQLKRLPNSTFKALSYEGESPKFKNWDYFRLLECFDTITKKPKQYLIKITLDPEGNFFSIWKELT